jgi:MFS family permease
MTTRSDQAGSYLRQFGRMNRNARLYLVSNTLNSISVGIFALLLNLYLVALGYQADFIGWMLVIGVVGGALGIVTASPVLARLGAKAALLWSSVLAGGIGALQLVIPNPFFLLGGSFVLGIAGGLYLVIGAPLLAEGSQESSRSHIFSLSAALALITTVIGQVLSGYLPAWFSLPAITHSWLLQALDPFLVPGAEARSYELALLMAGIITAPCFIPLIMMDPTPPVRHLSNRAISSHSTLVRRPKHGGGRQSGQSGQNGQNAPTPRQSKQNGQSGHFRLSWLVPTGIQYVRALLNGPIGHLAMIEGLIGLGAGLFIPYLNLYFVKHLGVSLTFYALMTAISTALMAVTTLAGPFFAVRLGKVRGAVIAHLASLPLLLLLGFTRALPLVLGAYLIRFSLMNMTEPVVLSFFMSVVKPEERAAANSAYNLSFYGLWAIGSAVGGLIITVGNFTLPFALAALLYFTATALLWHFFKDKEPRGRPSEAPQLEHVAS